MLTKFFNTHPGSFVLDCNKVDISIGRLASNISNFMNGKYSIYYSPNSTQLPDLYIINIDSLTIPDKKIYYRHTGTMGHLLERKASDLGNKETLLLAIKRMLDSNRRSKRIMSILTTNIYRKSVPKNCIDVNQCMKEIK